LPFHLAVRVPDQQGQLARLHRPRDDAPELEREGLEVELVPEPRAERLDRLLGVVPVPVEATVDEVLD
jgi:hypothetical protein